MSIKSDKTITDLLGTEIASTSLLNLFPVLYDKETNTYFLNIFRNYKMNPSMNKNYFNFYQTLEVEDIDWFDEIAFDLYGNSYLWWIVPLANDIINPFEGIEPGKLISVMRKEHLYQLLKEIKSIASL
jgi:hypothetical protein